MDRSLSNTYSSLIYDTSIRTSWNDNCAIIDLESDGFLLDINDLTVCRHNVVNAQLDLPSSRGDYLRYAVLEPLKNSEKLSLDLICKAMVTADDEKIRKRIHNTTDSFTLE